MRIMKLIHIFTIARALIIQEHSVIVIKNTISGGNDGMLKLFLPLIFVFEFLAQIWISISRIS